MKRLPAIVLATLPALGLAACSSESGSGDAPPASAPSAASGTTAMPDVEAMIEEAEAKLREVARLIEEKKFDLADAALEQVEAMEGLSEELLQRIETLRSSIDLGRSADELRGAIPGLSGDG